MAEIGEDIKIAALLLMAGEVVAIPTETVYGLAANALDVEAVAKIFKIKERPNSNPLILHFPYRSSIYDYVKEIPKALESLMDAFWPGPLTVLLEKKDRVPDEVNAGLPQVAVRIPEHPLTLQLLREINVPLAAPSANPFGYISPTTAEHVQDQLGHKIAYILEGGPCKRGLESTIVGLEKDQLVIYRLGAITVEDITSVFEGIVRIHVSDDQSPLAPGMLPYHYSPRTNLLLVDDPHSYLDQYDLDRIGVISHSWNIDEIPNEHTFELGSSEDFQETGRQLYTMLHSMDKLDLDVILVERFREIGLGKTINDRLTKAAAKRNE